MYFYSWPHRKGSMGRMFETTDLMPLPYVRTINYNIRNNLFFIDTSRGLDDYFYELFKKTLECKNIDY